MKYIIQIIMIFISLSLFSQNNSHEIKVLSRRQKDRILLRWATTTPSSWLKGNKYGYRIEKYVISKDGKRLPVPIKSTINEAIRIPEPLQNWEKIALSNDYAAILAQALYGEGFSVESNNNSDDALLKIINQSRESEQRFAFGLFAADMNFEAAKKAGIGFVDTNIKENENYYYKIISLVPDKVLKIKSGGVFVKTDKKDLPKPIDLFAVPQDRTVVLTWEYKLFKNLYVGYFVERSENGIDFKALHKQPLVNMNDQEKSRFSKMQYLDTIPSNNKKYYYRVKGITSFGEVSLPSDVKSALGFKKLEATPHITSYKLLKDGSARINWEFDEIAEKEISSFELNQSDKDQGNYKALIKEIQKKTRTLIIKNIEPSNYFTISAIGNNNQKTTSLSAFVQTIDSIPPKPPVGLEAIIDTTGVVNIKWGANLEKDLLGYRVFRAHTDKEEYVQLTISPTQEISFKDHVQLENLNSKVFYKVVAVDQRFNMSDFSEVLVVIKPDVIPPSPPVFSEYKVLTNSILLKWIKSSSDDVKLHRIFRKKIDSQQKWKLVTEIPIENDKKEWQDKSVSSKIKYKYAIFAEDYSGLISDPSTPITVTTKAFNKEGIIKSFKGSADREQKNITLNWTSNIKIQEYVLYKSKNKGVFTLYRQGLKSNMEIIDTKINPNNDYEYSLKAMDIQGNIEFKKIIVNY